MTIIIFRVLEVIEYETVDKMPIQKKISALDYIKNRILNFELLPGVKISYDEVAKNLGTSRTPIREALNRLVEQGLVESRPNRGFIVKIFDRKDVEDHYVLREALERLAVELAIKFINKERIQSLEALLSTYPTIMESNDIARFNEADEKFHDLIALYSENCALYNALYNLHGKIRIIRRFDHIRAGSIQETYEEHKKILKHLIRKDVKRATELMSYHILNSMKIVIGVIPNSR